MSNIVERLVESIREGRPLDMRGKQSWGEPHATALLEGVRRYVNIDPGIADRLSQFAEKLGLRSKAPQIVGPCLLARAISLRNLSCFGESLDLLTRASAEFGRAGDSAGNAEIEAEKVRVLMFLGRYDEALSAAERGAGQAVGVTLGRLKVNKGVLLTKLSNYREARENLNEGIEILEELGNRDEVALARANLAVLFLSTDDVKSARELLDLCAKTFDEEGAEVALAKVNLERAFLAKRSGRYDRALRFAREGAEVFSKLGMQAEMHIAELHVSEISLLLNLTDEAMNYAERAYEGFGSLGMQYNSALALAVKGKTLGSSGTYDESLRLLKSARESFDSLGVEVQVAEADWDLSEVHIASGNLGDGLEAARRARVTFEKLGLPSDRLRTELNIAEVYKSWGEVGRAEILFSEILKEAEKRRLDDIAFRAEHGLGLVMEVKGEMERALDFYLHSIERVERMRWLLGVEDYRISFLEGRLGAYESGVWLSLMLDRKSLAFELIERSKSRSLVDLILSRAEKETPGKFRDLREELNWLKKKGKGFGGKTRGLDVDEYDTGLLELPEEQSFWGRNEGIPSLSDFQNLLDGYTTVLEYYETRGFLVIFLTDRFGCDVIQLRIAPRDLESMVLRWEFDLEQFDFGAGFRRRRLEDLTRSAQRHLRSLYRELIEPLRERISDRRNLIIIPHGYLHKVPFHALFDGKSYLSDDFHISYAPSATALSQLLHHDWSGVGKALLIGVSTGGMPGLEAEIEGIAEILPDVRMVTDPVEAVDILSGGVKGYDLLHLGCHGAFRSDNPGYSYLDFGIRRFTANDIAALSIDVPLVTLSSCSSAKSVVMDGDEIIGMARGFLSSGARAFIASLWKVDDYATKELMISFYRSLKLGTSRMESLKAAQVELRRSFPHPYYWAPFVLIGSG